jgi:outer membrane protein OmpA-like peptidoglycan-associated protein
MMIIAICFFLVGASAGLFLAFRHFRRRRLPGAVAVVHGIAGAIGFAIVLFLFAHNQRVAPVRAALLILTLAIGLGVVNVVYHLRKVRHRSALIVAHALAAVSGVGTLAYGAFVGAASAPAPLPEPMPAPPPPPALMAAAPPSAARHEDVVAPSPRSAFPSITFAGSSATPDDTQTLAQIADLMTRDGDSGRVQVQGYSDERGSEALNLALSRARANAVVEALVARGVERSRLQATGLGSSPAQPICRAPQAPKSCHEESAWRLDRRVELLRSSS